MSLCHQLLRSISFPTSSVEAQVHGSSPHRNEQFEKINELVDTYQAAGKPVISMDTKKELIGSLYRAGHLYTQAPIEVYDHDWPSLAVGKAIPHGSMTWRRTQAMSKLASLTI